MRTRHRWDKIARNVAFEFLIIVSVVLVIVLSPVIIPLAVLSHSFYRKRLIAAARAFRCLSCSAVLGAESIRLADVAWDAYMRQLRETRLGIIFRVVRFFHAICPACGAYYAFLERERSFVVASLGGTKSPPAPSNSRATERLSSGKPG
jgi:hypothetical protein